MRAIRFLVAATLVLTASTAAAQGGQGGGGMGGTPEERQQRQHEMLFKGITLTDVQTVKIDSIQTAGRAANQALMASGGMQDPANREKMMESRRKQMADIRAVLTTDQQVVMDKNVAEMPQGGGRRPPNR